MSLYVEYTHLIAVQIFSHTVWQ